MRTRLRTNTSGSRNSSINPRPLGESSVTIIPPTPPTRTTTATSGKPTAAHAAISTPGTLAHLAHENGVDLIWNGHIHSYERTWPLDKGRPVSKNGTVHLITGGGGGHP